MKTKVIFNKILWVLAALFLALFMCFESVLSITVKADDQSSTYSNVLENLQQDEAFDVADYPAVADDYSLKIIQIAESVDKELFVYIYQPSRETLDFDITTIRLATPVVGIDTTWDDYALTLLSADGVFEKYKVENFTVSDDLVRYYDIVCVHRKFDETIDELTDLDYDQTIDEMVHPVGQLWRVEKENGVVTYTMEDSEFITVTAKIVGFVEYREGFKLYVDSCHSHFVAFSTDKPIDELMEADVKYVTKSYSVAYGLGLSGEPTIGDPVPKKVTLTADDKGGNDGDGLFGKKYTWERIEKVSDFVNKENTEDLNLTDSNLSDLADMDWVLRFAETDYTVYSGYGSTTVFKKLVSEVTILRLKFKTDGKPYNLGVVDDKRTGDDDPFAVADTAWDDFAEGFGTVFTALIILIIVIIALVIAGPFLPYVFKFIWWLICLPFKLLGRVFKGIGALFRKDK